MEPESPAIQTKELTKRFGAFTAVDKVSFEVRRGEVFGLLGPNGAGKTTIVRMLTTLIAPSEGHAFVAGFDVARHPRQVRENIGVIPQALTSDLDLTGWENVDIYGEFFGLSRRERRERGNRLLKMVGLSERAHDLVATYSGGMRRRLEIARGLIHSPDVLFLDEPTIGLDPQSRRAVWDLLETLRKESEITISLTTHYIDEAESLCDRIAIVDAGKIIALDTPIGAHSSATAATASNPRPTTARMPFRKFSKPSTKPATASPQSQFKNSRSKTCSSISPAARCATSRQKKSVCSWAPGCPSSADAIRRCSDSSSSQSCGAI
jgi:daunorubicin resistance ABC transporter ATP-binding subunit